MYPHPLRDEDLATVYSRPHVFGSPILLSLLKLPPNSKRTRIPLSILNRYPKNIAANVPRPIYRLDLLEVTDMTGMPHRPSSTDGHPSVSLLIAIALRPSTLPGYRRRMPVARARPIGYVYRLGRCGD